AREARGAGPGPAEGLRAAAPDLGRRHARPDRDERPRLGAPLLRDLPRDALRGDRPRALRRHRRRALPRRCLHRLPLRRARPRPRHHLASSLDRPPGLLRSHRRQGAPAGLRELPARQVALLGLARRLVRHRPRQGDVPDDRRRAADPIPEHRLHLLGAGAGARPRRRRRAAARLHALRRARLQDRRARRRRLLEAARDRAYVRLRVADLHHRRRHPAPDPAGRDHAPLHQLRRLQRGGELRPARGPPARLQPGERGARVNRQITKLALIGIALLTALIVATTYWQTWASAGLADRQDNEIQRVAQVSIRRGLIRAADGTILASNRIKKVGGQKLYLRRYPQGSLFAHLVGYSTQSRSRAGLEASLNNYLTGANANLDTVLKTTLDKIRGATIKGNDVWLTVKPNAQRVAMQLLAGRGGAVGALAPRRGEVVGVAS